MKKNRCLLMLSLLWGLLPLLHIELFPDQSILKTTWLAGVLFLSMISFLGMPPKKISLSLSSIDLLWSLLLLGLLFSFLRFSFFSSPESNARICYWGLFFLVHFWWKHSEENFLISTIHFTLMAGTIASIWGIYQYSSSLRVNFYAAQVSSFGNVNFAGAFLACSWTWFSFLLIPSFQKTLSKKIFWTVSLLLFLVYLLATESRANWLAFIASFGTLLGGVIYLLPKARISRRVLWQVGLGFLLVLAVFSYLFSLGERWKSIVQMNSKSHLVRTLIWERTGQMIQEQPFRGVGAGQFPHEFIKYRHKIEYIVSEGRVVTHPHNLYLLLATEAGGITLIVFLVLVLLTLKVLFHFSSSSKDPWINLAMGSSLIAFLVSSCFSNPFLTPASGIFLVLATGWASGQSKAILTFRFWPRLVPLVCAFLLLVFWGKAGISQFYLGSGQKLLREENLNASLDAFRQAARWREEGNIYLEEGRVLLAQGKYSAALSPLEKATRLSPYLENAYITLGIAQAQKGDTSAALSAWGKAQKLFPASSLNYMNLAKFYIDQQNGEGALKALHQAQVWNQSLEENFIYQMNLASAHILVGNNKEAILAYSQAQKIEPHKAVVSLSLGHLFSRMNAYDTAFSHYAQAVQKGNHEEQFQAYLEMAFVCEQSNRHHLVTTYYLKALKLQPKSIEGRIRLARWLYQAKNHALAEQILKSLLAAGQEEEETSLYLARIEASRKKYHLAQQYLQVAISKGFRSWDKLEREEVFAEFVQTHWYREIHK